MINVSLENSLNNGVFSALFCHDIGNGHCYFLKGSGHEFYYTGDEFYCFDIFVNFDDFLFNGDSDCIIPLSFELLLKRY